MAQRGSRVAVMKRGETATSELPSWVRLQGRTHARMFLLARDLEAEFVAPADRDAFAAVRGRTGGCSWELRVVLDNSDVARTGTIRHNLELDLIHDANESKFRFSGVGLVPPGLDPARVRAEIEAHCATFVRQQ